jgi:hypothetical protein
MVRLSETGGRVSLTPFASGVVGNVEGRCEGHVVGDEGWLVHEVVCCAGSRRGEGERGIVRGEKEVDRKSCLGHKSHTI